jgi:Raf kinase inhibitor-like YbhB/YbcL family protein
MKELTVKSSAFEHNKKIPIKYSCHGKDTNPPLTVENVPKEAKTLVLIVDDPDAPMGTFDHWVVWNIPASMGKIEEDSSPGTEGLNSARARGYTGMCPPSGTHRYFFKVYALDKALDLGFNSTKKDVEKAFEGHVLAKGELIGLFSK